MRSYKLFYYERMVIMLRKIIINFSIVITAICAAMIVINFTCLFYCTTFIDAFTFLVLGIIFIALTVTIIRLMEKVIDKDVEEEFKKKWKD